MRQLRPAPYQTKPEPCLPVCSSFALLAKAELKPVVSRQEEDQVPVWPVPRPRPRRVRGGPVAAREDRLPSSSQQEDRATQQVSSVWREGLYIKCFNYRFQRSCIKYIDLVSVEFCCSQHYAVTLVTDFLTIMYQDKIMVRKQRENIIKWGYLQSPTTTVH